MIQLNQIAAYLSKPVSNAPLVVFRLGFGMLLLYSSLRTLQKGWVKELYIDPVFHFSFLDWAQPLGGQGMYLVFILMVFGALGILLGLLYRLSAACFFILFTYTELIDKTYYLNHYYLVSILCFWLIFVPANRRYSIDLMLFPTLKTNHCHHWHILIFKVQLSIVYFFAGLAKVNPDWLFRAQPMATWLPGKYALPLLGKVVHLKSTAFLFSWAGCMYDLCIWLFLWLKRTRGIAYLLVLLFHILTAILFPRIGMFPFIMITSTIIFFSPEWHEKLIAHLPFSSREALEDSLRFSINRNLVSIVLGCYFMLQLYLPLRYLHYPGNLFWHERGYRWSWRVMLMEKNGLTSIIMRDPTNDFQKEVNQDLYLSPFQQQQMRSQPDMILQFVNHVGDEFYQQKGYKPEVYVKSRLSLNGRRSQPFTDEKMDVYNHTDPMNSGWILPFTSDE